MPPNPSPGRADGGSGTQNTRLDVRRLDDRAVHYFAQGIASSTLWTYRSGHDRFLKFCKLSGVEPLPASEVVLGGFIAHLADAGLKHRSIKVYLSGIRYFHVKAGLVDPFRGAMPRLDYIMRGVKKNEAVTGSSGRECLHITPVIMRQLRGVWCLSGESWDTKLIWAACCLCFFGFLRAGELTVPSNNGYDPAVHLNVGDLALDNATQPSLIRVKVKQSKTDPFRKGVDLYLGRTGTDLCPVATLLDYLRARGTTPGLLFTFEDGRLLTRQRFVDLVREALQKAGIPREKYCGHSFHIGAATTAAAKGVEDCVIQTLGRWESLAYLRYVRLPREQLAGYSTLLAS